MPSHSDDLFKSERQELFKTIFTYADTAVRNAMLINGGAAVAILAFIGNVVTKAATSTTTSALVGSFSVPLLCYVLGVFSAALTSGAAYAAQFCYYHYENKPHSGHLFRWLGIALILVSYALFVAAGILCYSVFRSFPNPSQ